MSTVFFDIDTQLDFLYPAGALYVPGAETLVPVLARLNHSGRFVISTTDAHPENDVEFRDWPPHCVAGCWGQSKPSATLLEARVVIPATPASIALGGARQAIVEKRALNLFTNPNLPELLRALEADAYVVYGVVTEYCVRFAALGLLDTGKPVTLVTDATRSLSDEAAARTLAEFTGRGGRLATAGEVCR